jgi:hypothetical protein
MGRSAKRTIDHNEIRRWVEEHDGMPAHVKRTADGEDPGVLRVDFPGYSGEDTLEEIAWDQWLDWFDKNNLAFLYQEGDSRFNKLVRRNDGDEDESASRSTSKSERAESTSGRWRSKTERVTINDASREELDALWGVGPATAERIIQARRKRRLESPEDLMSIDGIDGATARLIASEVEF